MECVCLEGTLFPTSLVHWRWDSPPPPKVLASCPTFIHLHVGVICLVKRGVQHAQLSFLHRLFSWEQPSPPDEGLLLLLKGPCSEGRLSDSALQHEEGCMRAHRNHTLHHFMRNQHIFPTSLSYFTFCSEHRWAVGGSYCCFSPVIKFDGCTF